MTLTSLISRKDTTGMINEPKDPLLVLITFRMREEITCVTRALATKQARATPEIGFLRKNSKATGRKIFLARKMVEVGHAQQTTDL
jgi:hypothetical protein